MENRANILFLLTDDQRYDTIGAVNNPVIHTPNLDYLVQRGTTFTNAHVMGGSVQAVCMPSRGMIHTGRSLFELEESGQSIPEHHALMCEHFRTNGYRTFGTGKWHNGTKSYARSFDDGGEIFFGGMDDHWNVPACDFAADGCYPEPVEHRWDPGTGTSRMVAKRFDHVRTGLHSSELFAQETRRFLLEQERDQPFFAYLSFMAPHDPRTMPQQYLNLYDQSTIPIPDNFRSEHPFDNGELHVRDELLAAIPRSPAETRGHIRDYYAMISHLDAQIGEVLNALKANGTLEHTIVILAGDNGLALGQHGLMGKQNLYSHSVRVPLIVSGPSIPGGQTRHDLCYLFDIFPTLCDLTGIEIPDSVTGQSLHEAIEGSPKTVRNDLYLAYRDMQRAVYDGRYKLIEYCVAGVRHTQLFDEAADPAELVDLSDDPKHEPTVQRLRKRMSMLRDAYGDGVDQYWV